MKSFTKNDHIKCWHITSLILIVLVSTAILGTFRDYDKILRVETLIVLKEEQKVSKNGPIPGCNLFSGKWVYDNVSYPLYDEEQCSFIGHKFPACKKYGRKSLKYQNWRWQPHHCDIPRFNGSALLEKIKGKRLIFVGDSLSRNQWESMFCLIKSASNTSWKLHDDDTGNFEAVLNEHNVRLEHHWEPLLVESNCDNAYDLKSPITVKINSIEKHGKKWMDADILVFDNFAWWTPQPHSWLNLLWGSDEDGIYKFMESTPRLYEMALNTWADWLQMQINPNRTTIYFMSNSPYHYGATLEDRFNCYGHTEPIFYENYWPDSVNRSMTQVLESVVQELEERGIKVEYLNITQLSGYRIDAHPSVYREYRFKPVLPDCLHWCLPGVPDVWNQILYTYIMLS